MPFESTTRVVCVAGNDHAHNTRRVMASAVESHAASGAKPSSGSLATSPTFALRAAWLTVPPVFYEMRTKPTRCSETALFGVQISTVLSFELFNFFPFFLAGPDTSLIDS